GAGGARPGVPRVSSRGAHAAPEARRCHHARGGARRTGPAATPRGRLSAAARRCGGGEGGRADPAGGRPGRGREAAARRPYGRAPFAGRGVGSRSGRGSVPARCRRTLEAVVPLPGAAQPLPLARPSPSVSSDREKPARNPGRAVDTPLSTLIPFGEFNGCSHRARGSGCNEGARGLRAPTFFPAFGFYLVTPGPSVLGTGPR